MNITDFWAALIIIVAMSVLVYGIWVSREMRYFFLYLILLVVIAFLVIGTTWGVIHFVNRLNNTETVEKP